MYIQFNWLINVAQYLLNIYNMYIYGSKALSKSS